MTLTEGTATIQGLHKAAKGANMKSMKKGAISTPFKDAVFTPKGISSPAPVNPNGSKGGKK